MSKTSFNPVTKIWKGGDRYPMFTSTTSVGQVALFVLTRNEDKIVQISDDSGNVLTNGELKLQIIRTAQHLQKLNIKKRDVIYLISRTNHHLPAVVFAASLIGAPIQSNNPRLIVSDIVHNLKITTPKIIFCETEKLTEIREAMKEINITVPIVTFDKRVENAMFIDEFLKETGKEKFFTPPSIGNNEEEFMAILSSSGTTGLSKGVCLTHAQILNGVETFGNFSKYDLLMCFTTLEWISSFFFLMLSVINGITRLVSREYFTPELFLKLVNKHKFSITFLPPFLCNQLLEYPEIHNTDLSCIKLFVCGGSNVPTSLHKNIQQHMKKAIVLNAYATTEIGGGVALNYNKNKIGSVGDLDRGIQVKITDDDGNRLGIGEVGEICVKAYYKFSGYYNNEKASRAAVDEEGFTLTGDIGYFDEDGYLYICDRKKDVFKSKTYHISPTEIEEVISSCPGVIDVCVVGIPVKLDELISALVIKSKNSKLTEKDIYDYVAERLIYYKHLNGGVYFVETFPTTLTGKVLRRKVKDIAVQFYNNKK